MPVGLLFVPQLISTLVFKLIFPTVLVLGNTEKELDNLLVTTISIFVSPSISPMASLSGPISV